MKKLGSTWQSDLAEAHTLENEFANELRKIYPSIIINQAPTDSSFTDWDIEAVFANGKITFELKLDRNVQRTGNIAVEFGRSVNGYFKPTCISVSKADVWVYYFENKYWLIGKNALKRLVRNCIKRNGGDGNRAHIYLLKKEAFMTEAVEAWAYLKD